MREAVWKYLLRNRLKSSEGKRNRAFLPLKEAKTAHIIYPASDSKYTEAAHEIEKSLMLLNIDICSTAWLDTSKKHVETEIENATILTNRDFNFFQWPKDFQAIPCFKQVNDYLILLGKGDELKLISLAATSQVKCRIGPAGLLSHNLFDIGYSLSSEASSQEIASEIMRILKMIRNER